MLHVLRKVPKGIEDLDSENVNIYLHSQCALGYQPPPPLLFHQPLPPL